MRPQSPDDVFDLLDMNITSAVLGAAMELGLFWVLAEQPSGAAELAQALEIPKNRCQYMLQLLERVGLVEPVAEGYAVSPTAKAAILEAYSRETWAFLAGESRERIPAVCNLAANIRSPESVWILQEITPPDYLEQLKQSAGEARRFTRMLYEIHLPLADEIAATVDMQGVERMMDLGGGSGVVSHALLRRNPDLTSVVVDLPTVCQAGREIAVENGMEDRISYHEADFVQDDLPTGFDLVLDCDVGAYNMGVLPKMRVALNPGGRLVIVDQFAPAPGIVPPSYVYWAFLASMANPDFALSTVEQAQELLEGAGFRFISETGLSPSEARRWSRDWTLVQASRE
jgi:demethylspheroidene O-methyltransferase